MITNHYFYFFKLSPDTISLYRGIHDNINFLGFSQPTFCNNIFFNVGVGTKVYKLLLMLWGGPPERGKN